MIALELNELQAKFLIIVIGTCAGKVSQEAGLYNVLCEKLGVESRHPDARWTEYKTIVVDSEMLDEVKCSNKF